MEFIVQNNKRSLGTVSLYSAFGSVKEKKYIIYINILEQIRQYISVIGQYWHTDILWYKIPPDTRPVQLRLLLTVDVQVKEVSVSPHFQSFVFFACMVEYSLAHLWSESFIGCKKDYDFKMA